VVNAGTCKDRPVPYDLRLLVIHAQRQTIDQYLCAVHVHRKELRS